DRDQPPWARDHDDGADRGGDANVLQRLSFREGRKRGGGQLQPHVRGVIAPPGPGGLPEAREPTGAAAVGPALRSFVIARFAFARALRVGAFGPVLGLLDLLDDGQASPRQPVGGIAHVCALTARNAWASASSWAFSSVNALAGSRCRPTFQAAAETARAAPGVKMRAQ